MSNNKIFFVRHGESENNVLEVDSTKLENKNQFGLTENGREQIETEAKKFNDFDLIISSPFRRAIESARIFAQTSHCDVIEDELLREVDLGDLELRTYKETNEWFKQNGSNESLAPPNGESLIDAKQRTSSSIKKLNQSYTNKRILIVTHGHIVLFLQELLIENFNRQHALDNYDDCESRKVVVITPKNYIR